MYNVFILSIGPPHFTSWQLIQASTIELKHYAEDEGKSEKEIAEITAPKIEYKFLAHGVLISK